MPPEQPTSPANHAFAGVLIAARENAGLTPEALADVAHVDRSAYAAIEHGERQIDLETIVQLASALDVSAAELLARAEL